jgi:hypothetical protein
MRMRSVAVLLFAAAISFAGDEASACGDKFLVVGRGSRLQRAYCAIRPASILVYVNHKSNRAKAMGDPQFHKALVQAGHKPQTINDLERLGDTVGAGEFDIVLADIDDAAAVERQLSAVDAKALLLPILYKPSAEEIATATKQFGTVLTAPDRVTHFLSVIDDAMKARQNAQARKL